jgi:predicted nucleotide-binding protein
MEKAGNQLELLILTGKEFIYENFSFKGNYGYPSSFTPAWVAWIARSEDLIVKIFGKNSPQHKMIRAALAIRTLGNGEDKFEAAKLAIIESLQSSLDILKEDIFEEVATEKTVSSEAYSNKVFVVHGHDDKSKSELEILLAEVGLEPVVLHRKPDEGQTIIEKFEKHSDVGYAFILLTPDEVAYLASEESKPDTERKKEKRARPNVIFEFGFFVGKLGRNRVCCLYRGDVALPSDVGGFLYKKFNSSIEEVAYNIIKELKACGYTLAH